MATFVMSWTIDIEADTAEQAAIIAENKMADPDRKLSTWGALDEEGYLESITLDRETNKVWGQ